MNVVHSQTQALENISSALARTEILLDSYLDIAVTAQERIEDRLQGALSMVEEIYLLLYCSMLGVAVCVALQLGLVVLWSRRQPDATALAFV